MNRVADLQLLAADWPVISRRLDEALAVAPAERSNWLEALHESEPVKSHLRRLLADAAGVETGDFLATLPKLTLGPATAMGGGESAAAGATIGPYRLLAQLGQGGMGTVWLAERIDGLPRRKVALKLPHVGWAPGLAARLARERDILASLEHPNIARLYDAGVDPLGRPYLALEYVDGTPIDRYCAAHSLPLRERLALLLQVAAAVAHAHTRLVVHRDLKPSNILVAAGGAVRLLDFGIAKLLENGADSSDLTQVSGGALTPDYASPEQIRGEAIGTASDVYSLGVVAYELLAGVRPYSLQGTGAGLAEAIAHVDVPLASHAAGAAEGPPLRGDLDAILNKALKKDAAERYATVAALADDLERHLRGETVGARPDSLWYRADRWVRRHKLETAVGLAIAVAVPAGAVAQAAVLAAVAGGAGVALWQAQRAQREARSAREEAARANAVKAFLTSFFKSGSLDEDQGAHLGRLSVQRFVERGAQKIDAGFEQQPTLKAELLDVVSTLFADLSDGTATIEYARKWQHTQERFGATAAERARASQRLAEGLALNDQRAEAAATLEHALGLLGVTRGAATSPLQAHLLVDLAKHHAALGKLHLALEGAEKALRIAAKQPDDVPGGAAAHAAALFTYAELMAADNRIDAAIPLFEDALARLGRQHGEKSIAVGRHRLVFAAALTAGRKAEVAVGECRRALQVFRESSGETGLNTAIVEMEFGRFLAWTGRSRSEGLAMLRHASGIFLARNDSVSPIYPAKANLYLAEAMIDDGDLEGAREPMQRAMTLFRDKIESVPDRTMAELIQARYLSECGDYEDADRLLEGIRTERERMFGQDHPEAAAASNRIGLNLLRQGNLDRARAAFESVLGSEDRREEIFGSVKHMAQQNLAVTRMESGQVALALPVLQRNFDLYHASVRSEPNATTEASLSLNLGRALLSAGQTAQALPLLQRNVDILGANCPSSPSLASSRCWLGLCALELGDESGARALAAAARGAFAVQPCAGEHHRRSLLLLDERLSAAQAGP